jgi:hypothetical protein
LRRKQTFKGIGGKTQPYFSRFISETSTILTGVPETMAHDFSLEKGHDDNTDSPLRDASQADDAFVSSTYRGTNSTEEDYPQQTPPPPPRQPHFLDMEDEMPLIKVDKKTRCHRRSMSVEDQLAGLTIEFSNLEVQQNIKSGIKECFTEQWA